jgi:hypothetical protein
MVNLKKSIRINSPLRWNLCSLKRKKLKRTKTKIATAIRRSERKIKRKMITLGLTA